ncbi:hypothetical protein BQ8420_07675 [Nocardiopsis sp. JB363]|nr:hypothetical protein BQ8420_07675 [Nocardiopsis sp. JB363]
MFLVPPRKAVGSPTSGVGPRDTHASGLRGEGRRATLDAAGRDRSGAFQY